MSVIPYFRVVLVSLVFGAALSAQVKTDLDKLVKVKEWGYQIQPIKGWKTMPADQNDRFNVGRWTLPTDQFEKKGDWDNMHAAQYCELAIVRIQPKNETPAGSPGTEEKPDKKERPIGLPAALEKRLNPKTLDDWIEANFEGASKRMKREPLKGSKMPGDLIEFGSGSQHITIGQFRSFGVEWAVVYTCFEESYRKNWRDAYIKSIGTFQVTDNVDPAVAAANRKDPSKLEGDEKREALKASVAGKPGWFTVDTKYYVFISNADRAFVTTLGNNLELVREKVYVPNFKPRNEKIPLNPVRVFATQSEYHQFGGYPGTAGYFDHRKGELVLFQKFDDQSAAKSKEDCKSVMFHEGFHQYIYYAIGDVSPHSWFNEGHGDYFAGLSVGGGQIGKTQCFEWRVNFLKKHMRDGNDLVPLRSLLRYEQQEYYSNGLLKYSEGWALIYYLREVCKDKAAKQALDTYFNYVADNVTAFRSKQKEGEAPVIPGTSYRFVSYEDNAKVQEILSQAVDKAFASVDLEALDKALRSWIEGL
ncbi:MAG TPA: hypothetical protein VFD82_04440 [Planctomycetota bacterium]|nr:hypothetical protein [Planctomycetota bacterium]